MRFAFRSCGSFAHGFSGFCLLGALLAGCGDDPAVHPAAPVEPPLESLTGEHFALRRSTNVSGYCAARNGARTAVATITAEHFQVLTSDSPALEETSFSAAAEVPGFDGSIECGLAPTATGFVAAWVTAAGTGEARVQRLSSDGSPDGETLTIGPSSNSRLALASDGDRIYVGRVATAEEGNEVWLDRIDGTDVSSERVALCRQPTLPALAAGPGGVGVFYACLGEERAELFGALPGEQPVLLGSAPAKVGQMSVAAASSLDSWLVQWIPPATPAEALPPLLELDAETLEATEYEAPERTPEAGAEPWFVDLVVSGERVFRQLGVCSLADAEMPGCYLELCALDLAAGAEHCTRLTQKATPGALLASASGATLTYAEQGPDFGGDLYSLVLDENAVVAGKPSPVVAPGPFAPFGVDCAGVWCTVFGREGQSVLAGADPHRYGFWTSEDVSNPAAPVLKDLVLDADGPVVASPIDAATWSVGLAYWDAAELRVSAFDSIGARFTQPVAEGGEPAALFFEASAARYRLFERRADGALASRTVDLAGVGEPTTVGPSTWQVMCKIGDGYLALDPETRATYRLSEEGALEGERLPPIREGARETWRCVGDALFGLAYNGSGALVYRGLPVDTGERRFESWTFGRPDGDGALGGGFGASAGDLQGERAVFFVERGGGFGAPLVAIVVGKQDEPKVYALDGATEDALLSAAVAPALGDPSVLRLVWAELGSRTATVSTWALP